MLPSSFPFQPQPGVAPAPLAQPLPPVTHGATAQPEGNPERQTGPWGGGAGERNRKSAQRSPAADGSGAPSGAMEDLDALLAELEQSSCLDAKDGGWQVPSACSPEPGTAGPPGPPGRQPLASVALKVQPAARAQPPGQALTTLYSPAPAPQPPLPSPPPRAAARQLDELLADLGHMQSQLATAGQGAGGAAEPEPSLDKMLGSLTQDLRELGISAAPAGACAACRKPVAGKVLTALGTTWHPEHFTCARCGQELGGRPFFERGGRAYCEEDYHRAFSPRCAYCASPIREKVLTALDRTWHPEHFFCAHCGKVFGDDGFHERGGKPYCRQDFLAMFAPKCQGCERAVTDNYLSALQGVWHPECFVCAECLSGFDSGSFFELEGRPYCELHFHQRQGSVCHGCSHPVTGRCVTAAGRRYHPEHFVCSYCLGQLQKGTFRERGDKMYCRACHDKLFL